MSKKLYMDFENNREGENTRSFLVQTIESLEEDLHLPGLVAAYNEGHITTLSKIDTGSEQVTISLHPYNDHVFGDLYDKGARLRVAVDAEDRAPYHFEIFFEELKGGMIRQNGFFRSHDERGNILWPRLVNETLRAITRSLLEYRPSTPDLEAQADPAPQEPLSKPPRYH